MYEFYTIYIKFARYYCRNLKKDIEADFYISDNVGPTSTADTGPDRDHTLGQNGLSKDSQL